MSVRLAKSITTIVKRRFLNGRNLENGWNERGTDSKAEIEIGIPKEVIVAVPAARVRVSIFS